MYGYLKEHVGAFGPHEIRTLVAALEKAWESVQAGGVNLDTGADAESARALLLAIPPTGFHETGVIKLRHANGSGNSIAALA
jgi:hypothetical protein